MRDAGDPVLDALYLDSLPEGASLSLRIWVAFRLSGVPIPPSSRWLIAHDGFAANDIMLATLQPDRDSFGGPALPKG